MISKWGSKLSGTLEKLDNYVVAIEFSYLDLICGGDKIIGGSLL